MTRIKPTKAQTPSEFQTRKLNPLDLELDPQNPRLTREEEGRSQEELLRIMIERFEADLLAKSIIASGYLHIDPLIGYQHNSTVTILEGNRRVAAIKLLLKPELAPEKHQSKWQKLSEQLPKNYRDELSTIPVDVYNDRNDIDLKAYIGFRHVTGVLQWPPLEKAGFIAQMVERGLTYEEIARRLGSYATHVERHYAAYRLVRQAADEEIPGTESMENLFGVLLRALQTPDVAKFLGISYPHNPKQSAKPVPNKNLENLRYFVEWTFGTKDKGRVLKDSRDLTKWGQILQSPAAVRYLKNTPQPEFDRAWLKSGGQKESLVESLYTASDRLEESVPLVSDHKQEKEVEEAVRQCTRFFTQILRYFPQIRQEYKVELKDD